MEDPGPVNNVKEKIVQKLLNLQTESFNTVTSCKFTTYYFCNLHKAYCQHSEQFMISIWS